MSLPFGLGKRKSLQAWCSRQAPLYASEYEAKDWDVRMQREPTVIQFPEHGMQSRDLVLGIQTSGASRAFLYDRVIQEKLVKGYVGAQPVLIVVGPDGQSVRAFGDRIPGVDGVPDFYRLTAKQSGVLLMDAATGSEWNFQGCAISGKAKGECLERIPMLKDYWFDWRNYNPKTTIWGEQHKVTHPAVLRSGRRHVKAAEPRRLADYVAIHRLEQSLACGVGR